MTTRRQLLAAAVAAPIVAVPAAMAQQFVCSPTDDLDIAIARFRQAWSEYQAHPIHNTRGNDPDYGRINTDSIAVSNRADEALEAALRVPTRSGADIAKKLDLILAEYQECQIPEDLIQIVADSARIFGEG